MAGFITKTNAIKCLPQLYKMGGLGLIAAVFNAPKGSTFLTVYFNHLAKKAN